MIATTWDAEQREQGWVHVTGWTVAHDPWGAPCIWLHRGPDDIHPMAYARMLRDGGIATGTFTAGAIPWPFGAAALGAAMTKLYEAWEATR